MGCVEIHPVVSPPSQAGKLGHRHQFHVSDPQFDEMVEAANRRIEGAFRCEGANVQLIDHGGSKRRLLPSCIRPGETAVLHPSRRSMNSLRLPGRPGIGKRTFPVNVVCIVDTMPDERGIDGPPAILRPVHLHAASGTLQLHEAGVWGPDTHFRHVCYSFFDRRPTGKRARSSESRIRPVSHRSPDKRSVHCPAGKSNAVSLQSPFNRSTSRGATDMTFSPRMKATRCEALAPEAKIGRYPPCEPKSSGRARRRCKLCRISQSLGRPSSDLARISSGEREGNSSSKRRRNAKSTGLRLSGSTRLKSQSSVPW